MSKRVRPRPPSDLPDPETLRHIFTARLKQQETHAARREEWRNRAAVLAWFQPWMIAGVEDDPEWITFLRADTEAVPGEDPRARRLGEPLRREALRRLQPWGWRRVRSEVAGTPPDDPEQRMLDAVLGSQGIETTQLTRDELDALNLVVGWLEGVEGTLLPDRMLIRTQLARRDLLGPLQRLSANFVFVGRKVELERLRLYFEGFRTSEIFTSPAAAASILTRQLMVVHGPGGIGKSTLISRYLIEHADKGLPFVYLDLDRPPLNPANALSLLVEALDQLSLQVGTVAEKAAGVRVNFSRWMQERRNNDVSGAEPAQSDYRLFRAVKDFGDVAQAALSSGHRLPFVIDTFEEAQRLGETALVALSMLVEELVRACPQIRPVICGRVAPDTMLFRYVALPLVALTVAEGVEFLAAYLERVDPGRQAADPRALQGVVSNISRTPLSLVLAAKVIAQEGTEALAERDLLSTVWRRLRAMIVDMSDEAELYDRVLGHIADLEVRALAKPGLLLRRLTPDIVLEVLAKICGLEIADHAAARNLLERLAHEVTLVDREPGPDVVLWHRQDVRRVMLPAMLRREAAATTRQIDTLAAAYYAGASEPVELAERLYHLLRLGEVATAKTEWSAGERTNAAIERLRNAIDEVGPDARRALKLRLGLGLTFLERSAADQEEWEQAASIAARAALNNGSFRPALTILRERSTRLPDSSLLPLEVSALSGLGRWQDVVDLALPAIDAAAARGDSNTVFELCLEAARACEALETLAQAGRFVDLAEEHAGRDKNPEHLLRALAARRHLAQLTGEGAAADYKGPAEHELARVAEVLRTEGVLDRLGTVALRELAAEFGSSDPSILRAALYRVGLGRVSDDLLQELAQRVAAIGGQHDRDDTIRATFGTVKKLPKDIGDMSAWLEWLRGVSGLLLGRAVASLLSTPGFLDLQTWAVKALKSSVPIRGSP